MNQPPPSSGPAKSSPHAVAILAATMKPNRLIPYRSDADGVRHLHVFAPDNLQHGDRRPAFLLIHGGGWSGGTPSVVYPIANHFARLGMVAFSLEYRLAKDRQTPPFVCVEDGRAAMRFLRTNAAALGIDPDRIVAGGGSAGGHVAAGTAMFDGFDAAADNPAVPARPAALVLYYPVIDTSAAGYGHLRCGPRWREISPLHRVRPGLPPTIIFHGTGDKVTPFEGARLFDEEMRRLGNTCELVPYPGGVHGYFLYDLGLLNDVLRKTEEFLAAHQLLPAGNTDAAQQPGRKNHK